MLKASKRALFLSPSDVDVRSFLCLFLHFNKTLMAVLRWWRNRTGRPLSPQQIHQKNISMLSKFYRTTSECWQRTSGTQKSRSLSSKTGRENIKDKKRDKGGREGAPSWEGNPVPERDLKREVSMNIGVHVSLSIMVSLVCMPSSGIAWSYGSSISNFLRNLHCFP